MIKIKKLYGMMILFAVIAVITNSNAIAGGINWKVNVKNTTPYTIKLHVWVNKLFTSSLKETKQVEPGSSYTFETGAYCPDRLGGEIHKNGVGWKSLGTFCLGLKTWHKSKVGNTECTAACWNSSINVVKMVDAEYEELRDYDYGFKTQ